MRLGTLEEGEYVNPEEGGSTKHHEPPSPLTLLPDGPKITIYYIYDMRIYIPLASSQLDLIRYVFVRGPAAAGYLHLALEFYTNMGPGP
jgi:hypothetical protein